MNLAEPFDALADVHGAPARHAALVLHAVAGADREWILSRLEPAQRSRVVPLLDELAMLDMPRDRALIEEARRTAESRLPAAPSLTELRARLSRVPIEAVFEVLDSEPDALIAQLLRCGDWPWSDRLLDRLGPFRCAAIRKCQEAHDEDLPSADELDRALFEEILATVARRRPLPASRGHATLKDLPRRIGMCARRAIARLAS